jgi:hypothetical protein
VFSYKRLRRFGLTLAATALGTAALTSPALAHAQHYRYTTLNNNGDSTFNQLLGINNSGVIAGYFGSGAQGHPNQGYLLFPQYFQNYFAANNYPGAVQTQAIGINDGGVLVGFWSDQNTQSGVNDNFGFYKQHGKFVNVNFPTSDNSTPPTNQLLGVNDSNVAVGFYNDSGGASHGYTYDINRHSFHLISVPGDVTSDTAAAINNRGDIAGFATINGNTVGFVLTRHGKFITFAKQGATMTQAFGINDEGVVAGTYTVGSGTGAKTHGFTWTVAHGFTKVNDPNGVGTTVVNGINDNGDLVGFYTDGAGNVDGMLVTPSH